MNGVNLLWSDNIDIENNQGWFGGGIISALFEIDFENNTYRYLERFEDCKIDDARKYSLCKKYSDKIFLFPVYGDKIWIYRIAKKSFSVLTIRNSKKYDKLRFLKVFLYKKRLYAISYDMNAIIEINPEEEVITNTFNIPKEMEFLAGNVTLNKNIIYCCSVKKGIFCQFNIDTKEMVCRDIPVVKKGIYTMQKVGENEIWFSGFDKVIYVWNNDTNQTRLISEFPEEFGIYKVGKDRNLILDTKSYENEDTFFTTSINLNGYVWFIPFRTNKIICVNCSTYKISAFEILGEDENYRSWKRDLNCKYLVEYIRENRYIGLYSLKNRMLLEIDTKEFTVKNRNIFLLESSIEKLKNEIVKEISFFNEESEEQKIIFGMAANKKKQTQGSTKNIGEIIYQKLI